MTTKFFDIEFPSIFADMIAIWEDQTGQTLERQDAERLMIQINAGAIYDYGKSWLALSDQTYLENKIGDQLDAYGDKWDAPRLTSTAAVSKVRFIFNTTILTPQIIYENTTITGSNDNGTFTFKVTSDVSVPVNSTQLDVDIEEYTSTGNSGALANDIEIGNMTTLDDSQYTYSFVESVSNVVESHDGHASEDDETYRARLFLAPSKLSTAGTAEGFKYFARQASPDIADVSHTKLNWVSQLWILPKNFDGGFNPVILGDADSQLSNLVLAGLDTTNTNDGVLYWDLSDAAGTRTFSIYKDSGKASADKVAEYSGADGTGVVVAEILSSGVTGTVDLQYSTDDTDVSNLINTSLIAVGLVDEAFNPATGNSKVRPINDIVEVYLINESAFTVSSVTIETIDKGSIPSVQIQALFVVNQFIDYLNNTAGENVVRSQLNAALSQIPGVYKVASILNSDATIDEIAVGGTAVAIGSVDAANISVTVKANT